MTGNVYTVSMKGVTTSAARVLVAVWSTAAAVFEVLDCWMTNEDRETSEQWAARLVELTATGTSTSTTPVNLQEGGAAATITGQTNYTAAPTAGDVYYRWGFNILNGLWVPFPDRSLPMSGIGTSQGIGLELLTTPGAATVLSAGMTVRQLLL